MKVGDLVKRKISTVWYSDKPWLVTKIWFEEIPGLESGAGIEMILLLDDPLKGCEHPSNGFEVCYSAEDPLK